MIKINAMMFAKMMKMLMDESGQSIYDIVDETGLHYITVQRYLRELYKEKVVYIRAWQKDAHGRDAIRIYAIGSREDARRKRLTGAERQARSRRKREMLGLTHLTAGRTNGLFGVPDQAGAVATPDARRAA